MSQVPAVTGSVATSPEKTGVSPLDSEKNATWPASAKIPSSAPALAPKVRSCLVCRSRKVRCDRQSPCSKCRQANIACVFPSRDRPPRWARRLERLTNNVAASNDPAPQDDDPGLARALDRLQKLEHLVKELSSQLAQADAAASSGGGGSTEAISPRSSTQDREAEHQRNTASATNSSSRQKQVGRLVHQDASRSRYVSSDFWSRVNDELDRLKMDTRSLAGDESDSSEDDASPGKTPSTQELERSPSERHAFLFRHNLSPSTPDLREFHPLPSQIPFLLDVFSENVNLFIQIVHIPTATKMVRGLRGSGMTGCTPAHEALMFSIYYAAINSMEEDDIMTNFGSSKSDLNLRYRLGLEHALAKADFLNVPDIVLVQAFALFLCLVRRHDSPRFVWMMTGLVIRMAQYLGLQRDGTHFTHLTPFEIEMRRKVWRLVCALDVRASEDQGTDLTIPSGSFDTRVPLNLNDEDIDPETKHMPTERDGVTDMSFARIFFGMDDIVRQMMAPSVRDGVAGLEDQSRLLNKIYQNFEQGYCQHTTESGNIAYWVGVTIARLVMAKMTLIVFLPILFSSQSEDISDEVRTKLLVSAIEVAEYNHALNAEQACRQWRWLYQTYTHWHAIVYLMIEISRRPWSPIVERAWVALHSSFLIPAQAPMDKNLDIWVPLRKLMQKASKHRDAELNRLQADQQAAARLEMEDQKFPIPSSSWPFSAGSSVDICRERWRQLVAIPEGAGDGIQTSGNSGAGLADPSMHTTCTSGPTARYPYDYSPDVFRSNISFEPPYISTSAQQVGQTLQSANIGDLEPAIATNAPSELAPGQTIGPSCSTFPTVPANWSVGHTMGPDLGHWLWADADLSASVASNLDLDSIDANMDLDGEVDWYNWVESAKGIEWDA